ncbi:MAG: histidine kinase [Candidatus Pseudobacter hemicellulosilyticus]|uniref:Histidine kinase n=1 Tax=Candidatus Pseudobacter hemicellulosilyticus TaxID=3121375 RepID=A0AAJ5WWH0_9BACT|nr:MAG: histidine kinase [Pseudobacter sp.]
MKTKQPGTKSPITMKVNDIGFRLILIPFCGILIPIAAHLVDHAKFSVWQILLSYLFTIGIAFLVWHGNRYLLFTLRSYFNWFNKPIRKIVVLVMAATCFTIPISVLLLLIWHQLFSQGIVNWEAVKQSTLIIMITVLFIVHVYETVFLVKESENEMLKNAQLEKAKIEAELEALKNQIDPHFIFNSLNTLSHLIEERPEKARQFNDNLADVYRYILQNKGRELVLLREEMAFLQDYFSLLTIRFEQAIQLELDIPACAYDEYLVPPISLQLLIENAIKHNEFSDAMPLAIRVLLQGELLVVSNPVQKKTFRRLSSRIGLNNLRERYKLTTNTDIGIKVENNEFIVSLPVLKIN